MFTSTFGPYSTFGRLLLLLAASTLCTLRAETILFEDAFAGVSLKTDWVTKRATQELDIANHALYTYIKDADKDIDARNSAAVVHEGDAGWTQIRYKVRVKPIRTYDIFTGGYYQEADLYFMVQYMTAINHGFVGTFYLLNLWGPDSTDAYPSTIDLVRYNDCGLTPCATHLAVNNLFTSDLIGADGYADITIKAIDAQIEVLMYNFLTSNWDRVVNVFDVPAVPGDPPVALTYGGVGVGSTWEGQAEFKDVVVSTPEPACWGCVAFGLIVLLARARRRRR